jgi:hypothetical protein
MRRRTDFRPCVERLEDRTVPSFLPQSGAPFQADGNGLDKYGDVAPAVAAAADGHFVVTYTVENPSGFWGGVFARIMNADGSPRGDDFNVNPFGTSQSGASSVAMDPAGAFVIAFQSPETIAAQLYSAAGTAVGSRITVFGGAPDTQFAPRVAMDAAGDFVVTWVAYDFSVPRVEARVFAANGTPLTDVFEVGPTNGNASPDVAMDSAGDFVVAWENLTLVAPSPSFMMEVDTQRYNLAGVAQGSMTTVAQSTFSGGAQAFLDSPAVAMDATGNYVVTWESFTHGGLFAQRFDNTGVAQGDTFYINQYGAAFQTNLSAAMDPAGDFVISWTSVAPGASPVPADFADDTQSEDGSGGGVYARAFNASGQDITGEFQVPQVSFDMQANPGAAMDASGDLIFAWQSHNQGDNAWNIYDRTYLNGTAGFGKNPQNESYIHIDAPSGNANFGFAQETSVGAYGNPHTNFTFGLNGFSQTYPDIPALYSISAPGTGNTAGLLTNDTYTTSTGQTTETQELLSLFETGGILERFSNGNFNSFLSLTNIATIYATMGPGDVGILQGIAGMANTFVGAGSYSYLENANTFAYITGAPYLYANAASPNDVAYQYDGSGPSNLVLMGPSPTPGLLLNSVSTMTGTDNGAVFHNEAHGFKTNIGIAQHPGQDTAIFHDTPRNDVFAGFSDHSYMYADNDDGSLAYFNEVFNFAQVNAISQNGGTDYAYVYDPQHVHTTGFIVLT